MEAYELQDSLINLSDLTNELKEAHDVWRCAKGSAIGPSRTSFDLMALPPVLIPYTAITEYIASEDKFVILFFGTGLVHIEGMELTGKDLRDTPNLFLRDTLVRLFRKVVDEKRENFCEFRYLSATGPHKLTLNGRWPLSENGSDVSAILSISHPLTDGYQLHKILDPQINEQRA